MKFLFALLVLILPTMSFGGVNPPIQPNWFDTNTVSGATAATSRTALGIGTAGTNAAGAFIGSLNGTGTNATFYQSQDSFTVGAATFYAVSNNINGSAYNVYGLGTNGSAIGHYENALGKAVDLGVWGQSFGAPYGNRFGIDMYDAQNITTAFGPGFVIFGTGIYGSPLFDTGVIAHPIAIYNPTNLTENWYKSLQDDRVGLRISYWDGPAGNFKNLWAAPVSGLTGTGTIGIATTNVTGVGTSFLTELRPGTRLINGGTMLGIVTTVTSATAATIHFPTTLSSGTSFTYELPSISVGLNTGGTAAFDSPSGLFISQASQAVPALRIASGGKSMGFGWSGTDFALQSEAGGGNVFKIASGAANNSFSIDQFSVVQAGYALATPGLTVSGASALNTETANTLTVSNSLTLPIGTSAAGWVWMSTNTGGLGFWGQVTGGSQTPVIQNIDFAGFNLTNSLNLSAQQGYFGSLTVTNAPTFNGANLTNITATNIAGASTNTLTLVKSNFVVGTPYTNTNAYPVIISGLSAIMTEAAVAGSSSLDQRVNGAKGVTNSVSQITAIGSLTGSMTNSLPAVIVDTNAVISWVDTSTGIGNSVTITGGQISYVNPVIIASSGAYNTLTIGTITAVTNGIASSLLVTNTGPVTIRFSPVLEQLSSAAIALAANNAVGCARITFPSQTLISNATYSLSVGVSSGLGSFGMYNSTGTTKILDTGPINMGTGDTGAKSVNFTAVTVAPGSYILAWTANSTTISFLCSPAQQANQLAILNLGANTEFGVATNVSVSGQLPATLGGITAGGIRVPIGAWKY